MNGQEMWQVVVASDKSYSKINIYNHQVLRTVTHEELRYISIHHASLPNNISHLNKHDYTCTYI